MPRSRKVDPAKTASEFDAGYHGRLLEKTWEVEAFVFQK